MHLKLLAVAFACLLVAVGAHARLFGHVGAGAVPPPAPTILTDMSGNILIDPSVTYMLVSP
jgi:hypothetical protein